MRSVQRLVCLLVILGVALLVTIPAAWAQEGTPPAEPKPSPPTQPATGPGGAEVTFPAAQMTKYGPDPGGFWIWEPVTGTEDGAAAVPGPFPLILYFSGCCGDPTETYPTPEEVDPWMSHLARQGYVVVAPVYTYGTPLEDSLALLPLALEELARPGHAGVDTARTAAIGFSYGGMTSILYAAAAAEAGLPAPRALLLTAPCTENGYCLDMPAEAPILPTGMKAIVIGYEHDFVIGNEPTIVWEALASLPLADRDFVLMRSDRHGMPSVSATHETTYDGVDAADWYGIWKLTDALLACVFADTWCDYALGNTPEQRFMGTWSDGVPVTELEVTDDPSA
jgi:dienelactone hydrolase